MVTLVYNLDWTKSTAHRGLEADSGCTFVAPGTTYFTLMYEFGMFQQLKNQKQGGRKKRKKFMIVVFYLPDLDF